MNPKRLTESGLKQKLVDFECLQILQKDKVSFTDIILCIARVYNKIYGCIFLQQSDILKMMKLSEIVNKMHSRINSVYREECKQKRMNGKSNAVKEIQGLINTIPEHQCLDVWNKFYKTEAITEFDNLIYKK
jgi:hypothetical protein